MVLNCQSIVGKKALLDNSISINKPDVIFGCESWLNSSIGNSEIFSSEFQVFRKDRKDGYGGVFLACNRTTAWQEISFQTNCEVIACKTVLNQQQDLIIMSIYRLPNRDYEYLESLCLLIHDVVSKNPKSAIWIGGDLNLPNIDWATNSVLSHDYPLPFCNLVIDTFNSLGFVQLVTFPNRKSNKPTIPGGELLSHSWYWGS